MFCSNCSAELTAGAHFCPRCGWQAVGTVPTPQAPSQGAAAAEGPVRLSFEGSAVQLLGWMLLTIVSAIVIVPLAWVYAAMLRWTLRNLHFSDGTTAEFTGTGGQIAIWMVFYILFVIGQQVLLRSMLEDGVLVTIVITVLSQFVAWAVGLMILKWAVYNVKLSSGPPLTFTGSYLGLLGYGLLLLVSIYSIVGWAWVIAAQYRWMARHVEGRGVVFDFKGKGHEVLWRTIVMILLSCLIVTIPWTLLWYWNWFVENISMTRRPADDSMFSGPNRPLPTA
ncbi:MAG: zinc-ribbon domain-containing protein [Acidobacteriota bacterium]